MPYIRKRRTRKNIRRNPRLRRRKTTTKAFRRRHSRK